MPLPAVTGELTGAVNNLAASIAACAAFQSLVGAASAAGAIDRVHYSALPKPACGAVHSLAELEGYRPYALIYSDETSGVTFVKDGAGVSDDFSAQTGVLHFYLERDVLPEDNENLSRVDSEWLEVVDAIASQLMDLSGVAGYISFNRLTLEGPMRSEEDVIETMGDYQAMIFHVEYQRG